MQRAFSSDERAVSEIVGALLLVVIVSSAAFGFGVFLHQQAKITQEQKALEMARFLEKLEVQAITPVDTYDASCILGADQVWDSVLVRVASLHVDASTIPTLRVNGYTVREAFVGTNSYNFSAGESIPVPARGILTIEIRNLDGHPASCGYADPYSLFGVAANQLIQTSDALHLEVLTERNNAFDATFVPPSAVASLEPTPGVNTSYSFVGSQSRAGSEGTFIVQWAWAAWEDNLCGTGPALGAANLPATSGHRVQFTIDLVNPGLHTYCVRLTVTDNNDLAGTAEFTFSAATP